MKTGFPAALLLLGLLLVCGPACSTLNTLGAGSSYLYSGTRENCRAFERPKASFFDPRGRRSLRQVVAALDPAFSLALLSRPEVSLDAWRGLRQFVAIVDFPCSLALDTVLVPVTIPLQLIHGDAPR